MSRSDPQVLIVGAGPTGLVLALWLAHAGVPLRIIDKASGPGTASRAMGIQARTLEFYRQLGIDGIVVDAGLKIDELRLRKAGRVRARFEVGDIGTGMSPFPFVLIIPQDDHERLLVDQLKALGVHIEWETELTSFRDDGDSVFAELRTPTGPEQARTSFLCGCDGARSTVREGLGLQFPGGTYAQRFFVADVEAEGPAMDGRLNACLDPGVFCIVFPLRRPGMARLIGVVPPDAEEDGVIDFEDVRDYVERVVDCRVTTVNWFSNYRVHHRVAEHFASGRAFVLGDAGHVHSPAGGQGMNTGIGDAVNLAWKLADVVRGRADVRLLDTYETERIRFARTLVATTDRAFSLIVDRGLRGWVVRNVLAPYVIPPLSRLGRPRRAAFRVLSQIRIEYRDSALSAGQAGAVRGGDRLPWIERPDNYAPLRSLDWQVHVYGAVRRGLMEEAARSGLPVHEFEWSPQFEQAGLHRDAAYVIRPDGHVATALPEQSGPLLPAVMRSRSKVDA